MQLQLANLWQRYRGDDVLRGLSLTLEAGEIGCLLGPSGCGKTTALRCIAGFESLTQGEILINGETVSRPGYTLAPERRQVGMVFQDAALLPHLDGLQNVAFGLRHLERKKRLKRAAEMLDVVGLAGVARQFPHELSGGQQQRIALARALAPGPRLLLLDEPFANLDAGLRERLNTDIRAILRQRSVTALMVTHDQLEAFTMADVVGVMHEGRLAQWGTPHEIYHSPVNRYVASFVGRGVLLAADIVDHERIDIGGIQLPLAVPTHLPRGSRVELLVRPDDVVPEADGMPGVVTQRTFLGASVVYTLQLENGVQVLSALPAHSEFQEGDAVRVAIRPHQLVLFDSPLTPGDDASGK